MAGICAADPSIAIRESVSLGGSTFTVDDEAFDLDAYDRIVVISGGNAAGHAAVGLEDILDELIADGAIVTDNPVETRHLRLLPGNHPIPSAPGVDSTAEVLSMADNIRSDDFVIALITGGASALLTASDGLSLQALQKTTDALLSSGATIHEINVVRKHLSEVKGWQLVRRLAPATVVGLLCSDVVGDKPSVIASGPISPDNSTYANTLDVIDGYDIDVPREVRASLQAALREYLRKLRQSRRIVSSESILR